MKRIGVGVIQLIALTVAVFFIIRLLPADPVSRLVGMNASAEAYAQAARQLGLDRSLPDQLSIYLGFQPSLQPGLLQGSLGLSWVTGAPVLSEIGTFLPITIELVTISFVVAFLIAVPVGMLGALNPGGNVDRAVFVYSLFAGSQPEFWWGLLFVFVFFFVLGIAPAPLGSLSPMTTPPPSVTGFMLVDTLLAGSPDKLQSDFVLYGNSIGLPRARIARYALRAAMAPSMTLIGILYGFMLSGAVLVESVFSLSGIGQYAVRSVLAFDYPAIQAVVLVITAISLLVYLMLDLIHAAIDPRIAF
jgi:ABC-type dipeptide/oligopeptide/nickel transport system permease component